MKKNCVICDAEFEGHWKKLSCSVVCTKRRKKNMRNKGKKRRVCEICKKDLPDDWQSSRTTCLGKEKNNQGLRDSECTKIKQRRYRLKWREERKILQTHICSECGNSFQSNTYQVKTCGKKCSVRRKRRVRSKNTEYVIQRCIQCNTILPLNTHGGSRYHCGDKCRIKSRREYGRNRYQIPKENIRTRISASIRHALRKKLIKKNVPTFDLLGYTVKELKAHLESLFTDGMSWDNMSEWHIDHIRPVSTFDFDSTEHPDFKKCWALDNLQPLWAADNMKKHNTWDGVTNA